MVVVINKIILFSILLAFASCELFGGGKEEPPAGEVVWSVENQTEVLVGTQPLLQAGRVYFLQDGYLKAYRLSDGQQLWGTRIAQRGAGDYARKILQSDDQLFVDQAYRIKAFNKADGALAWNTSITDDGQQVAGLGSPIMSQDQTYLYAGRKGYVLRLRKSDGAVARRYELDRLVPEGVVQGSTEPIISPYGDGILYVPTGYWDDTGSYPEESSGGNVFAIDAESGEYIWERRITVTTHNPYPDVPGDSLTGSPRVFDAELRGDLLVLLAGPAVVTLNRFTGEELWKTTFRDDGFDVGLATDETGVYTASVGRHATKLDLQTGEVQWRRNITYSNTSIPTVQDGRLYFNNSGGGGIWVLDAASGSVIYHRNTPHYATDNFDVYISSLGVGEGYMVNVGSKRVYCLTVP